MFTSEVGCYATIWVVRPNGTGLRQVTTDGWEKSFPAFSPDGTRLVVARQPSRADPAGSNLFKVRLDGTAVVKLTTVSSARWAHTDPCWANVVRR